MSICDKLKIIFSYFFDVFLDLKKVLLYKFQFHLYYPTTKNDFVSYLTVTLFFVYRWLSPGRACQRLLERFSQLLDALDSIYDEKHEPEIYRIRQMLADKKKIATATVLYDMLTPFVIFSDYLHVNLTQVNSKVKVLFLFKNAENIFVV